MATLDPLSPNAARALKLVRAAHALPPGKAREEALKTAREFLAACEEPRLSKLARLLTPEATPAQTLCALVPLERMDSRTRVTDADMALTDTDTPAREPSRFPLVVAADNLRSALNVGGLFRTGDFFAIESLWLCGYTATAEHPQVQRSALGADATVPWHHAENIRDVIADYHSRGYTVYALETSEAALPLPSAPLAFPAVLLLGSERFGLDPDVVAMADACLAIPGYGSKNSLNVVSAFSIAAQAFRTAY